MSKKVENHGDVGQVVMGNVDSSTTTVNINLNSDIEEPKLINGWQRASIAERVQQIIEKKVAERLEIYRMIFAHFDIVRIADLPADCYGRSLDYLSRIAPLFPDRPPQTTVPQDPPELAEETQCAECALKDAALQKHKASARMRVAVMFVVVAVQSVFLFYFR